MNYLRIAKAVLVAQVGLFATLVAFNNITDYYSNFNFVQHVLMMDTTFEGNAAMWRAIGLPAFHHFAYWIIIAFEGATGIICLFAATKLWFGRGANASFAAAKQVATLGLVLGITLWFTGFMTVGAEWFLMWQSPSWNGQSAAFRFIVIIFAVLLFLHTPEPAEEN
ncbi:DUF2165 domain-containing protein [Halioxenophilus sp. WMMB6]|uniref:DUF2165 family protein n=1 Tax=Halioxenophilus sp. WMMB6 TaxID=3073815 RepID=UPI00295F0451|nr:DUF2165 domain-containing protein [Halioxenophilus sp. WMMB6]